MQIPESLPHRKQAAGFTLPAILVVVGALLILAVGILLVVGIERNTAHSFADRERAELAARAGLEDIRGVLTQEAANDDFLILQGTNPVSDSKKDALPYLYLARGSGGGNAVKYRYLPLFSTATQPAPPSSNATLEAPKPKDLIGSDPKEFTTLPWCDPGKVAWVQIPDANGRIVSRYAYWVEDLQSRVDAGTAGNTKDGGVHKRYGWKAGDTSKFARFPAPGLNAEDSKPGSDGRDAEPPLDQVALYELDPASGAKDDSNLDKTIIDGRKALVSPDSVLAVAGVIPPLTRADGHLADAKARAVEENLTSSVRPYDEQPVVPYAKGIDASVTGKPKLNLNSLLAKPADKAVDEMAAWINKGLPAFDGRKGGFPEDYVKTLAASAIGYAASGNKPVVKMGNYRGLGSSPMLSEIVLDINYLGTATKAGNKIMQYQFVLFAELLNHTNLPISGTSALSFEVGLTLPAIGPIPAGTRFDELLADPTQCTHDLSPSGGRYWSKPQTVNLAPGEYKFYQFGAANYTINIGSASTGSQFTLTESLGAAGLSMKWNDKEVERIPSIVRDSTGLTFSSGLKRYFGKAAIPGHSYGPYGEFINNMGDPRIAHFIRFKGGASNSTNGIPLGENSFPENISPNRRNIRYKTIYSLSGDPAKLKTYGRVIPSEWPDGGHDAQVTIWDSGWTAARQGSASSNGTGPGFDPTTITGGTLPEPGEALTYLSDRGRFYSATELGRIYDPIMYVPTFDPSSGFNSASFNGNGEPTASGGTMPASGIPWPLVQIANASSIYFGGGNTLRIGRPEHPKFDQPTKHAPVDMPGNHAARLLDLFHAGKSRSGDVALREGPVIRVEGQVNINTASRDALRSMAAGFLGMDPKLMKRTSDNFDGRMAPAVQPLTTLSAPTATKEADRIADAIINGQPYATPSELACAAGTDGKQVFGNSDLYPDKNKVQWTDSAAEEVFGRVYEASSVRSRNFRVWVIGQSIAPTSATNTSPEVLGEVRKVFTVFADPGQRKTDGTIDPTKYRLTILHENDF